MIAYTFNQVKYILYHYYELSRGRIPDPEICEKLSIRLPTQTRAAYESACLIAGEVALRVRKCGLDGLVAEAVFMGNEGLRREGEVASEYHMDEADIHRRINSVANYCEGFDPKPETYEDWRRQNKFTRKLR
jgi:hypothetical protein